MKIRAKRSIAWKGSIVKRGAEGEIPEGMAKAFKEGVDYVVVGGKAPAKKEAPAKEAPKAPEAPEGDDAPKKAKKSK